MTDLLLMIDAAINLALGVTLFLFPAGLLRLLGLPDVRPSLYARVLGGVLFGIGLALLIERQAAGSGLGLNGAVAINLCGAAALAGVLMTQADHISVRGRVVLWGLCAVLAGLSTVELTAG